MAKSTGAARSRTPTSRHISPLCGSILPAARAAVSCRRTSTRNYLARVAKALESWRDPETAQPLVRRVYRREEIYRGDQVGRAPDLLIDWNHDHGYSYLSGRSLEDLSGQSLRRLAPGEFHSHEMATRGGSHRPNGLLMATGGSFTSRGTLQKASLSDLAPTILSLPTSGDPTRDGRPGFRTFQFRISQRQRSAAALRRGRGGGGGGTAADNYTAEEREIIERRLRDLGYL